MAKLGLGNGHHHHHPYHKHLHRHMHKHKHEPFNGKLGLGSGHRPHPSRPKPLAFHGQGPPGGPFVILAISAGGQPIFSPRGRMPHAVAECRTVPTQTPLTWYSIQKDIEELRRLKKFRYERLRRKVKAREGKQAKTKTQAPNKINENRKRRQERLMNRVKKIITKQNWWKGDLPEEVFQEALAIAEKRKWGQSDKRTQGYVKNEVVTSADAASSTSADAAPRPALRQFQVEITWSDDKVGDGGR